MAFQFPSNPSLNQQVIGPGGVIWTWDGEKWVSGGGVAPGGVGVPAGGDTNQVLTKASAVDFDMGWQSTDDGTY